MRLSSNSLYAKNTGTPFDNGANSILLRRGHLIPQHELQIIDNERNYTYYRYFFKGYPEQEIKTISMLSTQCGCEHYFTYPLLL